MNNNCTQIPYYIFVNGGDRMYLLGKNGNYLADNDSEKAIRFFDKIDALLYVEKYGIQRISTIRKVNVNTKA